MFSNSAKPRLSPNKNRNVISAMKEVNNELAIVHKSIAKQINVSTYEHATNYVNDYVAYTTIWNIKFHYNIESPEVALLQCLHLDYILKHQPTDAFQIEREAVEAMHQLFSQYKPFSEEQIETRKQKMQLYIEEQKRDAN